MPGSLNYTQQACIYNKFESFLYGIKLLHLEDKRRLEQIDASREILHHHIRAGVSQGLPLQEAMLEYLVIREHEDVLHLPKTPVPDVLVPHFQHLCHGELQAVVKRLGFYASSPSLSPASPPSHLLSEGNTSQKLGTVSSPQEPDQAAHTALEREVMRIVQEASQRTQGIRTSKEHFQALLRSSHLGLLIKHLAAATGERFSLYHLGNEHTFTVYIWWERGHRLYNYIEVRFDLDGTLTIQGVSIPMHVWLYKRKSLEKTLEQAYKYPKIYDACETRYLSSHKRRF